jgi:hypothetical protein
MEQPSDNEIKQALVIMMAKAGVAARLYEIEWIVADKNESIVYLKAGLRKSVNFSADFICLFGFYLNRRCPLPDKLVQFVRETLANYSSFDSQSSNQQKQEEADSENQQDEVDPDNQQE